MLGKCSEGELFQRTGKNEKTLPYKLFKAERERDRRKGPGKVKPGVYNVK